VTRAYRALVRLYPRSFRDEYGDDLVALFKDQRVDEPALRVWRRAVLDLAVTVPTQHLEAHMHRSSQRTVTVLAAGGAVIALAVGSVVGSVAVPALAVAVGAMWVSFASWRTNQVVDAPAWWKRVALGVALIAGVGITSAIPWPDSVDLGGDLAWSLGAITVIAALAFISSGLLLGALRRRPTRP
jgi:hypothetical protein